MRTVYFVNTETNVAADGALTAPEHVIAANTPPGHVAYEVVGKPALRPDTQLPAEARAVRKHVQVGRALSASRWTQDPDAKLTGQERAAWAQYRAQLRDLSDDAALPEPPGPPARPPPQQGGR